MTVAVEAHLLDIGAAVVKEESVMVVREAAAAASLSRGLARRRQRPDILYWASLSNECVANLTSRGFCLSIGECDKQADKPLTSSPNRRESIASYLGLAAKASCLSKKVVFTDLAEKETRKILGAARTLTWEILAGKS